MNAPKYVPYDHNWCEDRWYWEEKSGECCTMNMGWAAMSSEDSAMFLKQLGEKQMIELCD